MLDPERGELAQHSLQVQAAVRGDEVAGLGGHRGLGHRRQHPHDHLAVDRVGDPHRAVRGDEPQVAHVGVVVVEVLTLGCVALEQRCDHPPDAGLHQAGDEGVQVGLAGEDQRLLRLVHQGRDGGRWGGLPVGELVGERVDEPRLPPGGLPDPVKGGLGEDLARLGGVLLQQGAHLVAGEVGESEGLHLDVERARGAQPPGIPPARRLVVADVSEPAKRDRGGEAVGPISSKNKTRGRGHACAQACSERARSSPGGPAAGQGSGGRRSAGR